MTARNLYLEISLPQLIRSIKAIEKVIAQGDSNPHINNIWVELMGAYNGRVMWQDDLT